MSNRLPTMTDRSTALALLRRQLDDDGALFRDGQWEAIDSIVNDRARLLVVQRTGWGKSSVYSIATRMLRDLGRGRTLIVSPLLAGQCRGRDYSQPQATGSAAAVVACVPSYNQPMLVADFADRLAAALGRRFAPVVTKVRRNDPQKEQQNAVHQCRNLDGVFAVRGDLPGGPVLLVDDVVDSRWTLTVVAALLRRAGCDRVWPLALATSNPGA